MASEIGLIAESESFRGMTTGQQVLDALEGKFRALGATHFLVTGLPLPDRPVGPLMLRMNWGELHGDRTGAAALHHADGLLQHTLRARRPFVWSGRHGDHVSEPSVLLDELDPAASVVGIPVCAFLPYQAAVVAAGPALSIDDADRASLDHLCIAAFRRLFELDYVRPERPGDLSARERRVVELSAVGKTANQIASILEISQRTVHAHLQNASEKLHARNKTHTVVEALRYGQITV